MIIIPERRHPEYPQEPSPIDEPYLPEDPGDEPGDESHIPQVPVETEGNWIITFSDYFQSVNYR